MADENNINISIPRDAAHYLFMLLGDQLLEMNDDARYQHMETMRDAYLHIKEKIEQSMKII